MSLSTRRYYQLLLILFCHTVIFYTHIAKNVVNKICPFLKNEDFFLKMSIFFLKSANNSPIWEKNIHIFEKRTAFFLTIFCSAVILQIRECTNSIWIWGWPKVFTLPWIYLVFFSWCRPIGKKNMHLKVGKIVNGLCFVVWCTMRGFHSNVFFLFLQRGFFLTLRGWKYHPSWTDDLYIPWIIYMTNWWLWYRPVYMFTLYIVNSIYWSDYFWKYSV